MSREAKVFNVNTGRFNNSALQRVALELTSEVNKALARLGSENVLNSRIAKEASAGAGLSGTESGPRTKTNDCFVSGIAVAIKVADREGTIINDCVQLITHVARESRLLNEVDPWACVQGFGMDVGTNAVCFLGEDSVNNGCTVSLCKCADVGHNSRSLKLKFSLEDSH